MTAIDLKGCAPEPLASYLKALGVFRLLATQSRSPVRAWWEADTFKMESDLSQDELVRFFLEEYSPTPVVAPWNGGSGFYEGDAVAGRDAIVNSTSDRFALYRRTIADILAWPELPSTNQALGGLVERVQDAANASSGKLQAKLRKVVQDTEAAICAASPSLTRDDVLRLTVEELTEQAKNTKIDKKATAKEKVQKRTLDELMAAAKKLRAEAKKLSRTAGKEVIVQACRNRLHHLAVEWLDAAITVGPRGKLGTPPLMGTGGNEGRLEYSKTFMASVAATLLNADAESASQELLRNALFGESANGFVIASSGQHDPGRAGGYNQGPEIETKDFPTNPWNFILAMEGAIAWSSSVARRGSVQHSRWTCSPFTVASRAVGYDSAGSVDEEKSRAEVWLPLWGRPLGYAELRAFLAEGRANVGRRAASNTIEFAEAATSLGVDRGVNSFARFNLLKRRGDSYVALPAGRFAVEARTESDLVRELDPVLRGLDWFLRAFKDPPARFASARRAIDSEIYDLLLQGGALRVKALVAAIGRMEQLLATRDLAKKPALRSPLVGLSARWLTAMDDGSLEVRVATAIASIGRTGEVGPLRANLAPVDPQKPWKWAAGKGQTSWSGSTLADRLAGVLSRRMMDSERLSCESNPLFAAVPLVAQDVAAFIDQGTDDRLIEDLILGLMWLRWDDRDLVREARSQLMGRWSAPVVECPVPRAWSLLKLLFLPGPLKGREGKDLRIRAESSIVPLLAAGRIAEAAQVAQRRVRASGIPVAEVDFPNTPNGTRLAAALLIPIRGTERLLRMVTREVQES